MPTSDIHAARRERVRAALAERNLDALLVTHAANRYYLSGFELHDPQCNESAGAVLVSRRGDDWLLTDSRYLDAARRLWPEERIFIYGRPAHSSMGTFLRGVIQGPLGFESDGVSHHFAGKLGEHVGLVPTIGIVAQLRYVKDQAEQQAMRRACALNHKVFAQIQEHLRPGITEKALAWEVEKLYRSQGASGLSFDTIAAFGPNGALPHAIPGDDVLADNCPVLLDKGCRLDDYCSDQTRTFWVGDAPAGHFTRALEQTREAQEAGIKAVGPGLPIAGAYEAARAVFERHGVAAHFTHALGHGIGLETHEAPSLGPKATGVFEPGMIVTVEPGLYYPQWGGIRWEYMVLVTEDGNEIL